MLKEDIFKLDHEVEKRRKLRAEQAAAGNVEDMADPAAGHGKSMVRIW